MLPPLASRAVRTHLARTTSWYSLIHSCVPYERATLRHFEESVASAFPIVRTLLLTNSRRFLKSLSIQYLRWPLKIRHSIYKHLSYATTNKFLTHSPHLYNFEALQETPIYRRYSVCGSAVRFALWSDFLSPMRKESCHFLDPNAPLQ
jgi:hypothetical protein